MSVVIQSLLAPVQIAASATTYYTALLRTTIDKASVVNPSATTPYTISVYFVPSGGAAGDANAILKSQQIQALQSLDLYNLIGHTLNVGDFIAAIASSAAKINLFLSGRTFS